VLVLCLLVYKAVGAVDDPVVLFLLTKKTTPATAPTPTAAPTTPVVVTEALAPTPETVPLVDEPPDADAAAWFLLATALAAVGFKMISAQVFH